MSRHEQNPSEKIHAHLAAASTRAAAAHAERREQLERRPSEPQLGDIFLFRHQLGRGIEWALVERRLDDGKFLALALDSFPMVGAHDVELPPAARGGVANIRCAVGAWASVATLSDARRTGALAAEDLARVRARRRAVIDKTVVPTASEAEVGEDEDYRHWREATLRPAAREVEEEPEPEEKTNGRVLPFPQRFRQQLPQIAAGLAMAACLVLLIRATPFGGRDDPMANLPIAWLSPQADIRGPLKTLAVPAAARYVVLILEVSDPDPYPEYRLEIRQVDAEEPVYSAEVDGSAEIRVLLPRRLVSAGKYQLHLYGLSGSKVKLVDEYGLNVEIE